jgi:hypothetical protein
MFKNTSIHSTENDNEAHAHVVFRHLHSATNRRVLQGMSSFRPAEEMPDSMADLLRRLDIAESRQNRPR